MTVREQFPLGIPVHGEHTSTDATTAIALLNTKPRVALPHASAFLIGVDERLVIQQVAAFNGTAGNNDVYFDNNVLTAAFTPILFVDGGGGEDTVVLTDSGDLTDMFRVGRLFTVDNDTNNDGQHTSTGATFDAATNATTVTVATGSWTGVVSDGDVTADPVITPGARILSCDITLNGGHLGPNFAIEAMRYGPFGHGVWIVAEAGTNRVDVLYDGFLIRRVTKTLPLAPQARA